jgi:hypothetical protein
MLHKLFEQGEHYYRRTGEQRPEHDLFAILQHLESSAQLHGLVSSAFSFTIRHLREGVIS